MKKIMTILMSFILLITLVGCSPNNNQPISLTEENMYLTGQYVGQWDATETFARSYYNLDNNKEFVKPTASTFLIELNLILNKDGTYKISADEDQIKFAFDTFMSSMEVILELERDNLFDGDDAKWTEYTNERAETFETIVSKMLEALPMDILNISESGNFYINESSITFNKGSASIEQLNNAVKIKFEENNSYTNNEVSFIKK